MKLVFSTALLTCAILGNTATAQVNVKAPPEAAQKDASIWVARALTRLGYKTEGQTEGVGARPFDRFIEALDSERMVFTKADLASMEDLRTQSDKLTSEKQMAIPDAVFARYLARSAALHAYALEVLSQPLTFNGHERFQRVRSNAGWEADEAALRDLWRRHIMDDYLNLRQAGAPEDQIVPTLQRRYDRNLQRVQAMRSGEVADLFLHAYVQYYDPHGAYLSPTRTESDNLLADIVGIGMTLQKKDELITVLEVVAGTAAERSGDIARGDRIIGVAQGAGQPMKDVIGWKVDEVVALLRGAPGSQVVLDILPQGAPRGSTPRRVIVTRTKLQLDEQRAKGRIVVVPRGAASYRIGVITLPSYYQDFNARRTGAKDYLSASRDVAAALEQLKEQKADAILLDLRNNGGGSLTEAFELTGLFLPDVPVLQQVASDRKITVERTPKAPAVWDGPLAILIGRSSAAASEITAGAIQDNGRGLVLGDLSYGRGSVQTVLGLDRFSTNPAKAYGDLKMTVAVMCRANGKPIQPGVTPDIMIPGQIDVTGKANADLYGSTNCKQQDIARNGKLDAMLPKLAEQHASRMRANPTYQEQLALRSQQEKLISSDEVSLNEAERRRIANARPAGDIAQLQLKEALSVLGDVVAQHR
jgi:carboxyl-terminal processing protease